MIFLIVAIFLLSGLPVINADNTTPTMPQADYGIYSDMSELMAEMDVNRDSPDIINATEKRLESEFSTQEMLPIDPSEEFEVKTLSPQDPYEKTPTIFGDMEDYENIYGKNSILEFLMDRGISNYYIYTRYQGTYQFTRDFWRNMLILPMDLSNGAEIDIDGNPNTGDLNGNEIFVSLRPTITLIKMPTLFPFNRTLVLQVGLQVEFKRLVAVLPSPLAVQVIKYASYQDKNYIINMGVDFQKVPSTLTVNLFTEKMSIKLAPGELLLGFIENYLSGNPGIVDGETSILSSMQGPYHISYDLPGEPAELISEISVGVGLTEIVGGVREKVSWVKMDLENAQGNKYIPLRGSMVMDSQSLMSPMDYGMWEARDAVGNYTKCDIKTYYYDESEILTYAAGTMTDVPGLFNITVDYSKTINGTNVTPIQYRGSDIMTHMTYRHTQFLDGTVSDDYRTMGMTMEHIPRKFNMEITSDLNRDMPSILTTNASLNILSQMVDSLMGYIVERFSRIGRVMGGMATGVTDLPQRDGWMELEVLGDDHFGAVEFYRSSDVYLAPVDGKVFDYLTMINRSGHFSDRANVSGLELIPMAGRISGVNRLYMNFSEDAHLGMLLPGRSAEDEFKMMFRDGDTFFHVGFSNLPRGLEMNVGQDEILLRMDRGSGPVVRIKEMTAIYRDAEQYMCTRLQDISHEIHYREEEGTMEISSPVPFGNIEFYLSNDTSMPFKVMDGNYARLYQDSDRVILSGQVHSLKHIRYKPGAEGNFVMEYENETSFKAYLYNHMDGGSEAKVLIDPLPSNFSFDLPGAIGDMEFQLPDIVDISGNMDLTSLISSATLMVNNIVLLSSRLTVAFLENIGGISQEVKFDYILQEGETLDILGYFRKGDTSDLRKVHWVHGISLSQGLSEGTVGMEGKMYFQGMPKMGKIRSNITGDDVNVNLSFQGWRPEHPWLLIESYGIQDRDAVVYFNGLKTNIDFHLDMDLTTNMSIGGKIAGNISLDCSSNPGQLYVHFMKYGVITGATEILFSSLPQSMRVSILVFDEIAFDYSATSPIEYIYISNSRLIDGKWYHMNGLIHDLVEKIEFTLTLESGFDPKRAIFIQGLPRIDLTTVSEEGRLDLYFRVEGRVMGMVGNFEFQAKDIIGLKAAPLEGGAGYSIESEGMSYFSLKANDLPLMESFRIGNLEMHGSGLERVTIEVDMVFGVYPVFKFSDIRAESLEMNINGILEFGGQSYDAKVSLISVSTENLGSAMEMYNNKLALGSKSEKRLVIPAPILTLWYTLLDME
ncbi:MAG: hypothetical protein QF682_05415 [Candidatus Thermoplasmatota archaeon]|jgi:hypothetical protein|nr:hypothetical protein [Candidatus Thermoplasmatota archaeon]